MIRLKRQIREDDTLRKSFMDLALRTFNLSFASWYRQGFWTDSYIPYVFEEDGRVVANVSANRIHTVLDGVPRFYIQLGTVMTDPQYRHRGLASALIREVLQEWRSSCDGVYLYANQRVLDFYPRFGFERAVETQYTLPLAIDGGDYVRLDMEQEESRQLLLRRYQKSNPYSRLPMLDNWGLLMFYCGGPLKNCVYYSPSLDAVCIAAREQDRIICYDLFCDSGLSMEEQLRILPFPGNHQVILGFTPKNCKYCKQFPQSGEDPVFIWREKENPFQGQDLMFPLLSHA